MPLAQRGLLLAGIVDALSNLQEAKGSTGKTIVEYIMANPLPNMKMSKINSKLIYKAIKTACEAGILRDKGRRYQIDFEGMSALADASGLESRSNSDLHEMVDSGILRASVRCKKKSRRAKRAKKGGRKRRGSSKKGCKTKGGGRGRGRRRSRGRGGRGKGKSKGKGRSARRGRRRSRGGGKKKCKGKGKGSRRGRSRSRGGRKKMRKGKGKGSRRRRSKSRHGKKCKGKKRRSRSGEDRRGRRKPEEAGSFDSLGLLPSLHENVDAGASRRHSRKALDVCHSRELVNNLTYSYLRDCLDAKK